MNFLDTFDVPRSPTPNPDRLEREQPSLNEEVNQVIGQLGRFWGGFRKQSQQALETARKDFGEVVVQAQKELSKLSVGPETPKASTSESKEGEESTPVEPGNEAESSDTSASTDEAGESASTPREGVFSDEESNSHPTTTSSFFSRLHATLPPAIVTTVQNHIPESLKHASENGIDFGQLRTSLLSDLQRVQGVTMTQAEEYLHKSEVLFKEAVKEAGDVLREAVKVVPPEEAAAGGGGGLLWDGTDVWMLPFENVSSAAPLETGDGSGPSRAVHEPQTAVAAVATRAEALLKRLKHDPAILRLDPEQEENSNVVFDSWREKEVEMKEGGMEANKEWVARITEALEDPVDGQALRQLEESLVPAEMSKSVFWVRFFFRSHQIRVEEEKRKALILSTTETDEDFSWEDDEEESSSSIETKLLSVESLDKKGIPSSDNLLRPETINRRVNSEDSFDLVSTASASVSANVSTVGDAEKEAEKPKAGEEEGEGDSDWE